MDTQARGDPRNHVLGGGLDISGEGAIFGIILRHAQPFPR